MKSCDCLCVKRSSVLFYDIYIFICILYTYFISILVRQTDEETRTFFPNLLTQDELKKPQYFISPNYLWHTRCLVFHSVNKECFKSFLLNETLIEQNRDTGIKRQAFLSCQVGSILVTELNCKVCLTECSTVNSLFQSLLLNIYYEIHMF